MIKKHIDFEEIESFMKIEEKKRELRRYVKYQEELETLYDRLNTIRIKCYGKAGVQAITYSDMPKGGISPDMADEVANMIDLEKSIINKILKIHSKINKLDKAIEDLKDIELIRVIKLKYFKRYSIPQIARKMYLSENTIKRRHKKALNMLNLWN